MQQNLKDNQEHLSNLQKAWAHNELVQIYSDQWTQIKTLEDGQQDDGMHIRTLENALAVEGTQIKQLENLIDNSMKWCEVQIQVTCEEVEVKLKDIEAKCEHVGMKHEVEERLW
ncbi:hypothetical protein BDR04DRAFT_1205603 [Suillus decipiens]|nr:hypothetical protein BDR04DRAFT_1205603 [Suillus decipiens]